MLTPEQVRDRTNLSVSNLAKRRVAGLPPRYVKLGKKIGYLEADVEAFIQANIRASTGG